MENHVSSGGLCRHVVHLREAKAAAAQGTPGLGLAPTKGLGPSPPGGGTVPMSAPPEHWGSRCPSVRGTKRQGTGEHWAQPDPHLPPQPSLRTRSHHQKH